MYRTILSILFLALAGQASADEVKVAVAANFTAAMKEIAEAFEAETGHTALLSFGSTGKLYTQIIHGAPFEVFLAADQVRPQRLEDEGKARGRFTYATGKLVLWSKLPDYVDAEGKVLAEGDFNRLAIANPKTAPYGAAALEVLSKLELDKKLMPKLVRGDSITQTHQFVASGNAQLGFVALAQVVLRSDRSSWKVPQALYTPIRQDAVLLKTGDDNPAAVALIGFLKSSQVQSIVGQFGYGTD